MTTLKELQDSFQKAVVDGDDAVLAEILDSSKEKRDVLLGVYRNAYVLRLVEFLTNDYEKLHAFLGDDQFELVAREYVASHPSRTSNARWYGSALPEFLKTTSPYKDTPALAELAALEKALNDVFDAPDAAPLTLEDFAKIAPESWPQLTFAPHPAVQRLDLQTNAAEIWRALHNKEKPPSPAELNSPLFLLVYRTGAISHYRIVPTEEAMMWDEASQSVTFSVLCEMLAIHGGEDTAAMRAAGYLRAWVEAGILASVESA